MHKNALESRVGPDTSGMDAPGLQQNLHWIHLKLTYFIYKNYYINTYTWNGCLSLEALKNKILLHLKWMSPSTPSLMEFQYSWNWCPTDNR